MACEAARNRTSRRDRTAAVITLFQEEGSWEEDAEATELVAPAPPSNTTREEGGGGGGASG